MSFSRLTLAQFIDAIADAEPTPGGGTAAAVTGAMGVALLMMVAGLARTRGNTDDERAALEAARVKLAPLRENLERCADRDAEAFVAVMAAYRLPKATDEDKARRKAAVQQALKGATDVPLETVRLTAEALEIGEVVARFGNPSAASDAGVAAGLLHAAGEGAAANVRTNLKGIADASYRAQTDGETARLLERGGEALGRMRGALG